MSQSYFSHTDDTEAALKAAQVRYMFRMSLFGSIAGTLVALALGMHYWLAHGGTVAPAFVAYFLIVGVVRSVVFLAYRRAEDVDSNPESWLLAATFTMLASGVGWAWAALAFFELSPIPTLVVLTAMGVSGSLLLASSTRVLAAFCAPLLAGLFFQLLSAGQALYYVLAAILALVMGIMLVQAWFLRRSIHASLALRLDNDRLGRMLANAHREVAGLSDRLEGDARLRQKAEEEAKAAKIAAAAANMAKDEFLATMSHEIRTPLNGILPILDLLRGTELNDSQRDYLDTACQSSRHLLNIIDDILDYSKIEAGKLELESVGLNLREVLDSVVRLMTSSAENKGLRLHAEIDGDVRPAMRGDPVRLRQVLTNLVSNAVKFTDQGSVTVNVSRREDFPSETELLFTVRDTGIGMDKKTADRLFRPFAQADASTTRTYGGTGLGLAICKRLVELMNGRIGVKSQPGEGSVFWFTVRLKKSIGDIEARQKPVGGSRALLVSPDEELERRLAVLASNWELKLSCVRTLGEAGNRVRNAAELGSSWQFDTLLLDLRTRPAEVTALAQEVRQDPRLEDLGVLLLGDSDEIPAALGEAHRVLARPWKAPEQRLRDAIEVLLAGGGAPASAAVTADELGLAPEARGAALSGRVLLVEDNPVNLHVAQKLLEVMGLAFEVAGNGKEALELLQAGHAQFDAVLMDCMMPVMDGYAATRAWRELEAAAGLERTPIIAMTANAMAGDRQKCLDAGMDDYMSKPMNRSLLRQTLERWLSPGEATAAAPGAETAAPAPEAASPASMPLIDREVLGDLADIMGPDFDDLVAAYLDDAPRLLRELAGAAENKAFAAMVRPAHSLKSSSANLGASRLAALARELEQLAREGTVSQPKRRVADLIRTYKLLAAQLRKTLPKTA